MHITNNNKKVSLYLNSLGRLTSECSISKKRFSFCVNTAEPTKCFLNFVFQAPN